MIPSGRTAEKKKKLGDWRAQPTPELDAFAANHSLVRASRCALIHSPGSPASKRGQPLGCGRVMALNLRLSAPGMFAQASSSFWTSSFMSTTSLMYCSKYVKG